MTNITPHHKVKDIVEHNYLYASVFHYFGISFEAFCEYSLQELCDDKSLNIQYMLKKFNNFNEQKLTLETLKSYSTIPLIEYLRVTHRDFVKNRLPYFIDLISRVDSRDSRFEDLKIIFPVFVDDFIKHIYHEEQSLFTYILHLASHKEDQHSFGHAYFLNQKKSICEYAIEHIEDDELGGVRELCDGFIIKASYSLVERVLMTELKAFDEALKFHAKIENECLISLAYQLEDKYRESLKQSVKLN